MVLLLSMIIRTYVQPVPFHLPLTGIVSKVYEASFQIRTLYGTVQCITDESVSLDAIVQVEGTLIHENTSSFFYPVTSVSDYSVIASDIKVCVQLYTLRHVIYQRIMSFDKDLVKNFLKKSVLRLSSADDLSGLDFVQLVLLLHVMKNIYRKQFSDKSWKKLEPVLIVFFCLLWNMPFVGFRMFYFRKIKDYPVSTYDGLGFFGILVYLFSPDLALSSSFWFVFVVRLIGCSLESNRCVMLFFIGLIQLCFQCTVDLIDLILFQINQMISIFSFVIGIFVLILKIDVSVWIEMIESFTAFIPSFELRGSVSLAVILLLILWFGMIDKKMQVCLMTVIVVFICVLGTNPFGRIVFLNAGQGDAILIQSPLSLTTILIDTGPPSSYAQLKKSLYGQSVDEIDVLVLTHADNDHSGNKDALMKDFKVKRVIESPTDFEIDKNLYFYQINEIHPEQDENENSLVLVSKMNGLNYLFCGDATKKQEMMFVEKLDERMDVCKIGHHGSDTSTSWQLLDGAECPIAIISAGLNNRYGHPHAEVMDRLTKNGSTILNTAVDGDIQITMTRFFHLITTSSNESVIIISE